MGPVIEKGDAIIPKGDVERWFVGEASVHDRALNLRGFSVFAIILVKYKGEVVSMHGFPRVTSLVSTDETSTTYEREHLPIAVFNV